MQYKLLEMVLVSTHTPSINPISYCLSWIFQSPVLSPLATVGGGRIFEFSVNLPLTDDESLQSAGGNLQKLSTRPLPQQ